MQQHEGMRWYFVSAKSISTNYYYACKNDKLANAAIYFHFYRSPAKRSLPTKSTGLPPRYTQTRRAHAIVRSVAEHERMQRYFLFFQIDRENAKLLGWRMQPLTSTCIAVHARRDNGDR